MNSISILAFLLCAAFCYGLVQTGPDGHYITKYDNINIEQILGNQRVLDTYVRCFTVGQQCTPDGKALREMLPDALATTCNKCSDKQKQLLVDVIKTMTKSHPKEWKTLTDKWDPDHKYLEAFKKAYPDLYAQVTQ